MKFSVLLPTRDRLEYFRHTVHSLLRQDYDDWELLVSDNASSDDYESYIASLDDPRIVYSRSSVPLDVTSNWNRALSMSTGDLIVMLGDDDGLMDGYFRTLAGIVREHPEADAVYTGGLLFAWPGVMPGHPDGYLQSCSYATFLKGLEAPAPVSAAVRMDAVRAAFGLRATYPYNMQFALMTRAYIERTAPDGELFRSPYPDYYAMNVLMATARAVIACPLPLVAVGVTPRSFGFFFFNGREGEGVTMLATDGLLDAARTMPGSKHLRSWLAALMEVRDRYPQLQFRVAERRYRLLQAGFVFRTVYLPGRSGDFPRDAFWRAFPPVERWIGRSAFTVVSAILRAAPEPLRRAGTGVIRRLGRRAMKESLWDEAPHLRGRFRTLSDVVDNVRPDVALTATASG